MDLLSSFISLQLFPFASISFYFRKYILLIGEDKTFQDKRHYLEGFHYSKMAQCVCELP